MTTEVTIKVQPVEDKEVCLCFGEVDPETGETVIDQTTLRVIDPRAGLTTTVHSEQSFVVFERDRIPAAFEDEEESE